jgi:hypothetical protein
MSILMNWRVASCESTARRKTEETGAGNCSSHSISEMKVEVEATTAVPGPQVDVRKLETAEIEFILPRHHGESSVIEVTLEAI